MCKKQKRTGRAAVELNQGLAHRSVGGGSCSRRVGVRAFRFLLTFTFAPSLSHHSLQIDSPFAYHFTFRQ